MPIFILIPLLALIYFIAGKLSLMVTNHSQIVTIAAFSAEGFALAAVILFGRRVWPGIFFGQLILASSSGLALYPALIISAINSAEAVIAFTLFQKFNLNKELSTIKDVIGLLLIITIILQPFSALLGNLTLYSFDAISIQALQSSVFSWWLGNTVGQILFTPALLLIAVHFKTVFKIDSLILIFLALTLNYLIFVLVPIQNLSILFIISFTFVIFILSNRGMAHAMMLVVFLSMSALYFTHIGHGIFSSDSILDNIINLNFYILSQVLLVLSVGALLAERETAIKEIESLALYDGVTGLPNRNLLEQTLKFSLSTAVRYKKSCAVCFIDIDGFKQVNDTYGHNAGDEVLRVVASRVLNEIRESDSLIRIGGDEFVLILNDTEKKDGISTLLQRVLHTANQDILIKDNAAVISLSIGVAAFPNDSELADDLLEYSDKAMYKAKESGKNKFVYYNN